MDICILQAKHLRLLKRAHTPMWAEHKHTHATFAAHGVFGSTARIATGCAQDIELLAAPRQFILEQVAQQLHGHVFKSQRGAVGKRLKVQAAFELFKRRDGWVAKNGGSVGFFANGFQVGRGYIVDIQRQNLKRQRRIALGGIHLAPCGQRAAAYLRIALRQIQATIGCKPFEQNFTKTTGGGIATSRDVVHGLGYGLNWYESD